MKNSGIYIAAGIVYLLIKVFEFVQTFIGPIDITLNVYRGISVVGELSFCILLFSLAQIAKLFNERKAVVYSVYFLLTASIIIFSYYFFVEDRRPNSMSIVISCLAILAFIFFIIQSFLMRVQPIAFYFKIISCSIILAMLFTIIFPFLNFPNFMLVYDRGNIILISLAPLVILMLIIRVRRYKLDALGS